MESCFRKQRSQFRLSVTRWRNTNTLEKCKMHFVCRETDRKRNWGDIVWQWHTCLLLYFSLSLFSCFIELEHSIGKAKESWKSFCNGHFRHLLNLPLAQVKSKCQLCTMFFVVKSLGCNLSFGQVYPWGRWHIVMLTIWALAKSSTQVIQEMYLYLSFV